MRDPNCVMCRLVDGQIGAEIVHSDSATVALLDVRPLADGHVLVVPRTHAGRVEDLPAADAAALFRSVAALAGPVRRAVGASGTTIGVNDGEATGQTIPHVHVHIVPRWPGDGAGSIHTIFRAGTRRPLAEVAEAVRRAVSTAAAPETSRGRR
jgi:histidine triad (HIT) family protein